MDYMPVCGSDDVTYANKCGLNYAACKAEEMGLEPITLAHERECEQVHKWLTDNSVGWVNFF